MVKKIVIAGIVGSLAIASAFFTVPAIAQGPGVKPPANSPRGGGGRNERHPVLHRAMNQLERVNDELAKAADDYQGHKEQARDLIQRAIAQLKIAIQGDKH